MEINVKRLFSHIWLTTDPPKQKYQHRDDIVRITLDIINNNPEVERLKKILMYEDCYLIHFQYEKDNPIPSEKSSNKNIVRDYSIINSWYVTDLSNTINITPIMMRYGFPLCAYEAINKNSYGDKLNGIIANKVFSPSHELTEYEIRLGKVFYEFL